jgi:hypothetical protein
MYDTNIILNIHAFIQIFFKKSTKKSKIPYLKKMQKYNLICVHIELEPKYQIPATLRSIWRLLES